MTPRDKQVPPPPTTPELQALVERLVSEGMSRVDEISSRLPAEMHVSAAQVQGVLDDVLTHLNVAELVSTVRAELFRLISTGHSSVRHDPVNLA